MDNCLTCRNWNGDKQKMNDIIMEYGEVAMDLDRGFPEDGSCSVRLNDSVNIHIDGDAYVEITVDANFGCIHYQPSD